MRRSGTPATGFCGGMQTTSTSRLHSKRFRILETGEWGIMSQVWDGPRLPGCRGVLSPTSESVLGSVLGLTPVFIRRKGITPPPSPIRAWIQEPYRGEFLPCLQAGGKREARAASGSRGNAGAADSRMVGSCGASLLSPRSSDPGSAEPGHPRRGPAVPARRGAGRGQWAMRGALRTAAPRAGPRCTVSVKLQQLTGHRNLITHSPAPFPPASVLGSLLLGDDTKRRRPSAQRERDGENVQRFRGSGTLQPLLSLLAAGPAPSSLLQRAAILAP